LFLAIKRYRGNKRTTS